MLPRDNFLQITMFFPDLIKMAYVEVSSDQLYEGKAMAAILFCRDVFYFLN